MLIKHNNEITEEKQTKRNKVDYVINLKKKQKWMKGQIFHITV